MSEYVCHVKWHKCNILHSLQGQVDLDAEIAKCDKKLDVAQLSADKIRKIISQADYETTVPENVRTVNAEKACYSRKKSPYHANVQYVLAENI